jgi:hypothetical protein
VHEPEAVMRDLMDWIQEKIARFEVKRKFRKYPPKVRALQVLLIDNPNLLKKSEYDRRMENHFARHPRVLNPTRPTPYRRGVII